MSSFVNLLDIVYPVGSIYMSTSSTSPATIIGGSWTQLDEATYLCAAGSSETGLSKHGENMHTLTLDEMPMHQHGHTGNWKWEVSDGWSSGGYNISNASSGNATYANSYYTGGDKAHNNRPLSMSVYIWYRTA